ncbi:hypothetical protein LX32DRAFT_642524 [Colletotrichum zoysiae]|uniref:Uncharacterized protein n=1 Tax=Colletotrichum zoysiae TaxID=1216348 RepID=A0AAD9M178_9PEZI|nr:hypothetical protein LX32DRAFT_642524 [Colletotrichum zoysiae]
MVYFAVLLSSLLSPVFALASSAIQADHITTYLLSVSLDDKEWPVRVFRDAPFPWR